LGVELGWGRLGLLWSLGLIVLGLGLLLALLTKISPNFFASTFLVISLWIIWVMSFISFFVKIVSSLLL
jgi:hypothetical protein